MEATMGQQTTNSAQEGPAKARDPWRDEKGRYLPGNPGGPGNPMAREMARVRALLAQRVDDRVLDLVVAQLIDLCSKGHFGALRLLLEYRAGKPERGVRFDEVPLDQ